VTARILVVEHEAQCPPGRLGEWLSATGATVVVWRPWAGEEPPASYDALVVLGGSTSANDDTVPWTGAVLEMVRAAASARTPTLGICLGHQMIGRALGGAVEVNPRGQQVGVLDLGWTADAGHDALFGGSLPARAVQWNDDLVVTLPDGAVPLAQTPHGELQAARFADTVWGVQVHPEVDAVICRSWADGDRDHHREHGVDQDQLMVDITESEEELAASWAPVARRLVELVEPVDR
jgi:GMP synthase (glutamine-hydrolysing)